MKNTKITINVGLDENHIPEVMTWDAPDGGIQQKETKALLLSVWDEKENEALRIDLWTKDMEVDKMKRFFHQVFISLSSSYERATGDDVVSKKIIEFAENFAYDSGIKS